MLQKSKGESRSAGSVFAIVLSAIIGIALVGAGVWFAFNRGYLKVPTIRVPNFIIPKINVQRESSYNSHNNLSAGREDNNIETPKDINSNDPFESPTQTTNELPIPKQKMTKINEVIPVFSTGNELLIEPDIDDD